MDNIYDLFDILPEKICNFLSEVTEDDLHTISTGYGIEDIQDFINLENGNDDCTIDTANGVELRNIIPNCNQCRKLCTFTELPEQKGQGCSNGSQCRSLKMRKYEFTCMPCGISICLPCSMSSGSVHAVDKIVNTSSSLTPLIGNNGKMEVC